MFKNIKKTRSERKHLEDFANQNSLVYFGVIDDKSHAPIQGATFTADRLDEHFMHGRVKGFDVSVVKRTANYTSHQKTTDTHTWLIVQVEKLELSLPFVFINARQHSWNYYNQLHAKYPTLKEVSNGLQSTNPTFTDNFRVYTRLASTHFAFDFLHDALMQQLAYYYPTHDVELEDSNLRIVVPVQDTITPKMIREALSQALWLAETSEYTVQAEISASATIAA